MSNEYEIIVAGGGIAGLTAGLTAARLGRKTLVLTGDQLGGTLLSIEKIEGFPGYPEGIAGFELCPSVQMDASEAGADFETIEIQALDGAPGVWSARFAQFDGLQPTPREACPELAERVTRPTKNSVSYHDNNVKLLKLLEKTPSEERTARFRCVVALVQPNSASHVVEGSCNGMIAYAERGSHGFGYDPLFIPHGYNKTLAELGEEIKNRISHRAHALAKAREILQNLYPDI